MSAPGAVDTSAAAPPQRVLVVASLTSSLVNFRLDLLEAMVARGHKVLAVAPDRDPAAEAALHAIGVGFVRIPMARASLSPAGDLRTLAALVRLIRRWRPDVLLPYTMKPIIYGLLAGRLAGVPDRFALVTGLGYVFGEGGGSRSRALVRRLSVVLYRIAMRGVRRVFVYNEADAGDVIGSRMISDPTRLIPVPGTGVNLARFPFRDLPPGPPVFLMIARLLREKGVTDYVEAARQLRVRRPDLRFQLLGPLDPNPTGLKRADVDAWVEEGAIEYLGETDDVRPFLAAATVFVLPTYYREGTPRTLQEAMAMGRPVVTTDMPGCRETVEEGRNGYLVPPRDPAALAEVLWRFVEDPALAPLMGREARRAVTERFDVRAINRLLLAQMGLDRTLTQPRMPVVQAAES